MAAKGRVVHVHLSDCPKMPPEEVRDDHRVLPGEGVIDLKGFFATLRQIGYAGWVSLELMNPMLWRGNPAQLAELGLMALRRVLGLAEPHVS